jgi:hypothetical protein
MTRLQAIKQLRAGKILKKIFITEHYGTDEDIEVWLYPDDQPLQKTNKIRARLCVVGSHPNWVVLTSKQVLDSLEGIMTDDKDAN